MVNFLSTLTGSFAQPAAENPTVAMVEAAYRAAGLDARYVNCEVAPVDLGDAVRGARAMGWAGFNCSIPHKVAVVDHLDELAPSASIIGAVNCVVRRGDRLVGENTDGQGFLASLRTVVDPAGADVVVFGAGGAARAIAVESALAGAASITVLNRDRARAARRWPTSSPSAHRRRRRSWRGRAATGCPTTSTSSSTPHPWDCSPTSTACSTSTSNRCSRTWSSPTSSPTRRARTCSETLHARGCRTLDGLGMLVNQGVLGIKLWTGVDADHAVMLDTVRRLLLS